MFYTDEQIGDPCKIGDKYDPPIADERGKQKEHIDDLHSFVREDTLFKFVHRIHLANDISLILILLYCGAFFKLASGVINVKMIVYRGYMVWVKCGRKYRLL